MKIALSHPAARGAAGVRAFQGGTGGALLLAPDAEEAERLFEAARALLPEDRPPRLLPPWPEVGFEPLAPPPEVAGDRVLALRALSGTDEGGTLVIAEVAAVLRRTRPGSFFREAALPLVYAQMCDPWELRRRLAALGYLPAAEVTQAGEFAARGGILDLFPPGSPRGLPVRIEFEEDLVARIRLFDPSSQRTVEEVDPLDSVAIHPAREVPCVPDPEAAARFLAAIARPGLRAEALAEAIREGAYREGIEAALPFLDSAESILSWPVRVIVSRPDEVRSAAERAWTEVSAESESSDLGYDPQRLWAPPSDVESALARAECSILCAPDDPATAAPALRPLPTAPPDATVLRVDLAALNPPGRLAGEKTRIVVSTEFCDRVRDAAIEAAPSVAIDIREGNLHEGTWIPEWNLALLGDADLFGPRRRRRRGTKAKRALLDWGTLAPGDPVVHIQHGVGIYRGLTRITVSGAERDVIRIEYAGSDVLYLPPTASDRIERWRAPEGTQLRLDTLGGATWDRTRAKVTQETQETARRLLDLYALRETIRGTAYPPHPDEASFAASFPYEETPDQEAALVSALAAIAADRPADHLVVGDVGFGKTEIALRAAFRVVRHGAQVALLAPTTILAEQHGATVADRMRPFGVRTGVLSRLRSPDETDATIAALGRGEIDLVVGTHRLLSQDVAFRRLGLVVVDEEQRFGVRHKERLKEIRRVAHSLTLTATPIPRTLHLALSGMRDLSVIRTPPPGRTPVATIVAPYNDELIRKAIARERARNGGTFFIHNRIETLDRVRAHLLRLLPDLRIVSLHGKSDTDEMARGMRAFASGEAELLLSTSIVENGLDIPRANTLIVDRADAFGLADLYQLRGRVGRSNLRAFAYFLHPTDRPITPGGRERLEKVAEHTALGSGFHLAMEDLELRGAGEILGAKQSGLFAQVGYDLYVRLLREAVEEARGVRTERSEPASVDLSWNTYLPAEWTGSDDLAPSLYRALAEARTLAELAETREGLRDRFGPSPEPVENLLRSAELGLWAALDGVRRIHQVEDRVEITWEREIPEGAWAAAARANLPRWREGRTLRIAPGEAKPARLFDLLRRIVRR